MEDYYCPKCFDKLERLSGCGAVGYMCNTCKRLVSRKNILSYQERMAKIKQKENPEE
ncbi:zinc-ribbon domain-containing protein [Sinanaerobacter chloroacetimidivorans]|jgi:hypothetical protein|uniref:Zinc-ribbon domain-containing protein n=1 Tax=Sinanaerobacter chloroacetimidivorans TaxID=2818044 RepID=A0A8J7W439_9FIRM|nr:zinc-ribbon domain-containing protein [Sinanaerobacter chloroacetimidivorans]MBR0598726.1 zinc-ribbon domain-containing protein [Sinanaerobacter chloroacetimidivorans]